MAVTAGRTYIDLSGMKKFSREVESGLRSTGPGPIRDAIHQWAFRYRSAMRERFDRFSKGGGDWAALKPATIAARRHGKGGKFKRGKRAHAKAKSTGGGQVSILRDTGQLYAVLSPRFSRLPGQYERDVAYGILVGYGGGGQKKTRKGKKSKLTVAEVAAVHQEGKGRNPERKILVDPSRELVKKMAADVERALKRILARSQARGV